MKYLTMLMICTLMIISCALGYVGGKRAADRWYARNIPCSTHCLTYPVQNEGVTLIPPIRSRAPESVASVEEPK